MFTVYSEKEAFENIVLCNDTTPNWYNVCCNHSDVCLNINDKDLLNELIPGTIIFEYVKANGGKEPIALFDFFENIREEPSCIAEKPRAAFILDITKEKAEEYQSDFGVLVQSNCSIDDNILQQTYYRELPENSIVEKSTKAGWFHLFNFNLPPSNCAVISDDFLLNNTEKDSIVGIPNLKSIFNAILPTNLKVPFHILVLTNDGTKTQKQCEQIAGQLKTTFTSLRSYPIIFEIVFTSALHKRKLFTNYLSVTCDRGFAMFKVSDLKTVRKGNDFRSEMLFTRLIPEQGDSVLKSDNLLLKEIQNRCNEVKASIKVNGQTTNYRIMGDCKTDKSINNRLIQEV